MNRSGIDITAGTVSPQVYAGFLIRELDRRDGPGKAIKTIVRTGLDDPEFAYNWSPAEETTLKQIRGQSIWSGDLTLRKCEKKADELWIGPRLNLKYSAEPWNANLRISTWQTQHPEGMKRI